MIRVSTKPRRRNSPRPPEKSAPAFLQWLRGRECAVRDECCSGKIEAAHVDFAGDKGIGTKVSDRFSIPLCAGHHHDQHWTGWQTFQRDNCFDALGAAEAYWRAWPGRIAWERKQEGGQ